MSIRTNSTGPVLNAIQAALVAVVVTVLVLAAATVVVKSAYSAEPQHLMTFLEQTNPDVEHHQVGPGAVFIQPETFGLAEPACMPTSVLSAVATKLGHSPVSLSRHPNGSSMIGLLLPAEGVVLFFAVDPDGASACLFAGVKALPPLTG